MKIQELNIPVNNKNTQYLYSDNACISERTLKHDRLYFTFFEGTDVILDCLDWLDFYHCNELKKEKIYKNLHIK